MLKIPAFNSPAFYPRYIEILRSTMESSSMLFGGYLQKNSVWTALPFLLEELSLLGNQQAENNIDGAFFTSLVSLVDFDALAQVDAQLRKIIDVCDQGRAGISEKGKADEHLQTDIGDALKQMNLTDESVEYFCEVFSSLDSQSRATVFSALNELQKKYQDFAKTFEPVAFALLYLNPEKIVADVAECQLLFQKNRDTQWASLCRFLGQSYVGRIAEVRQWAGGVLLNESLEQHIGDGREKVFFVCIVYLVFGDFASLNDTDQVNLIQKYGWLALYFGFPLRMVIEDDLADQFTVTEYLARSGAYADALLHGGQLITNVTEGSKKITVGDFLNQFLISNTDNDFQQSALAGYVDKKVGEYNQNEIAPLLFELLSLYAHLHECDLIDYHGLLYQEGIQRPYDWKTVISKNISSEDSEGIQRYFTLVHNPILLKVELIVAFQEVAWDQEPILSRVLSLSSLYEEVYGSANGPLVYFDSSSDGWRLRKELPKPWTPHLT